jgi:hypothetical protein
MLSLDYEIVQNIFNGTELLDTMIEDFQNALEAHTLTVNVPAPICPSPIVEEIVRHYGGLYQVINIPEPEPEPEPTPPRQLILMERDRRLALGFDYDFGDERGVHRIATTPEDMVGWNDVTTLANALKGLEDTTTTIQILTETGLVEINCIEWFQICIAAAEFRQPIWKSSFILEATDPIPEDFTDDTYWS